MRNQKNIYGLPSPLIKSIHEFNNTISKNMQPYLIVVGFTICQAFSLIMTMTQEWLFTFRTNKMLWRKLYTFLDYLEVTVFFLESKSNNVNVTSTEPLILLKRRIKTCLQHFNPKVTKKGSKVMCYQRTEWREIK